MKSFLILLCFWQVLAHARSRDVSLNQDVFVCGDQVRALALLEYQVVNQKDIGLPKNLGSLSAAMTWLQQDLQALSPSRARMVQKIFSDPNHQISYQENVQIQRVSPSSQFVLPEGCRVEPLLVFSLSMDSIKKPFSAIISKDLFSKLNFQEQAIVLWTLALDAEQVMFSLNRMQDDVSIDFEFNQLRSRQFIQCWLDSSCKPNSVVEFHQFSKNIQLDYFEQGGVLIPRKSVIWNANGFIQSGRKIVYFFSYDFKDELSSQVVFPDQTYRISASSEQGISYANDGRLQCAPLSRVQQNFGAFSGAWNSAASDSAYPFSFPLCWDKNFHLLQGYFPISWDSNFQFDLHGATMKISQDRLGGGQDQGTVIVLDSNYNIKWLNHVSGTPKFGVNGAKEISGYLKLREDQSIECAQLSKDADLKDASGSVFKFRGKNKTTDYVLCFNAKGEYEKSYSIYDFSPFFQRDLIFVGN